MNKTILCIPVGINVLFCGVYCLSSSVAPSSSTRVVGFGPAIGEVSTIQKKCHHRCRRHGCSWYNANCLPAPITCTAGTEVPQEPVAATCPQDDERDCVREYQNIAFNVCEQTGEVNPQSPQNCDTGEEQCTIECKIFLWKRLYR